MILHTVPTQPFSSLHYSLLVQYPLQLDPIEHCHSRCNGVENGEYPMEESRSVAGKPAHLVAPSTLANQSHIGVAEKLANHLALFFRILCFCHRKRDICFKTTSTYIYNRNDISKDCHTNVNRL